MSISVDPNYLWEGPDRVIAFLARFSKTYNEKNKWVQELTIYNYDIDPDLCPVTMLKYYLAVSEQYRRKLGSYINSLFITTAGSPASCDTCAQWVHEVLSESGIDPSVYKPHSVPLASACHKLEKGYPLEQVLVQGAWASEHTFMLHYRRNIEFESLGDIEVMSTCSLPGSPRSSCQPSRSPPRKAIPGKYTRLRYKKAVTKHLVHKFRKRQSKIIKKSKKQSRFSTFGAILAINSTKSRPKLVVPTVINPTPLRGKVVTSRANWYNPKPKFAPIIGNNRHTEGRVQAVRSRPRDARGKWTKAVTTPLPSTSTARQAITSAPGHTASESTQEPTPMSPPPTRPPSRASSRHSSSSRGRAWKLSAGSAKSGHTANYASPSPSPDDHVSSRTRSHSRSATPVPTSGKDEAPVDLTVETVRKHLNFSPVKTS